MPTVDTTAEPGFSHNTSAESTIPEVKCCISPRLYTAEFRAISPRQKVNLAPNPQIKKEDVLKLDVTLNVQNISANVVLNNRQSADKRFEGGRYKYPLKDLVPAGVGGAANIFDGANNISNFCGVKPIRIDYGIMQPNLELSSSVGVFNPDGGFGPYEGGYKQSPVKRRFTGYITNYNFNRSSPGNNSTVTLRCDDVSVKAKDTFVTCVPFFDGFCHISVLYYLLVIEAGYKDEEVLFYQDPDNINNIKLSDVMFYEGHPEDMLCGCWNGHIDGFDKAIAGAAKGAQAQGLCGPRVPRAQELRGSPLGGHVRRRS